MRRIIFFGLYLFAAANASAAIYQWRDENGTTQFSDQRPAGAYDVTERLDTETHENRPNIAAVPKRQPSRAKSSTPNARNSPRHSAQHEDSAREQRQQRCDKYRRRIATTQSKLRAGYSARGGIALTERLRADRDVYYHDCR